MSNILFQCITISFSMIPSSRSPVVTILIVCWTVWLCVLVIFNQSICLHHLSNECLSLIFPCNRHISVYHFFTCTVHQKTFIQSTCLCHFIIVFSSLLTYVGILVASHRSFLSHLHLWEKWYKKD